MCFIFGKAYQFGWRMALGLLMIAAAPLRPAQADQHVNDYLKTLVIHSFGPSQSGAPTGSPASGLVFDRFGDLFGVTGYGLIFELTPPPPGAPYKGWKYIVLSELVKGWEPAAPVGPLLIDAAGNLYGVTAFGGPNTCDGAAGCGTIFRLKPPNGDHKDWTEEDLYDFSGQADGGEPRSGLVADASGNLYGSTLLGAKPGGGNVFQLAPPASGQGNWSYRVIYSSATYLGNAPLNIDAAGNLYGIEELSVFKLSPPSSENTEWTKTTIAVTKEGIANGLVFDKLGNLYGTTIADYGVPSGSIFRLSPPSSGVKWTYTTLRRLSETDGNYPDCTLAIDDAGNLFGTSFYGGHSSGLGQGTVFELTLDGTLKILHKFDDTRAGNGPIGGPLIFDGSGNIYGTTNETDGGTGGAVWELLAD